MAIRSLAGRAAGALAVIVCGYGPALGLPIAAVHLDDAGTTHSQASPTPTRSVVVVLRSASVAGFLAAPAAPDVDDASAAVAAQVLQTLTAQRARGVKTLLDGAPGDPALAAALGLDRILIVDAAGDAQELAGALNALEGVESVEPAYPGQILGAPDDPLFRDQYGLRNQNTPGADIHAIGAWRHTRGAPAVTIAIVDTGISHSHPDLAPNLLPGRNFTQSGSPDDADDSRVISHGTLVAGVAGARGSNGVGIAGTCWNARLLPVRVANQFGVSSDAQCAAGIIWAADQGARVINVSLGFPVAGSVLELAVEYATMRGSLVCAASGNTPGIPIHAPARYPSVLCVGATDSADQVPAFVTTGPQMAIAAPGVDIVTTEDTLGNPDGYAANTGTSLACPFVAGAAALVWSVNPNLTGQQVRYVLIATADDLGAPGWDERSGWGRLNAARAVQLADPNPQPACSVDWDRNGVVDTLDFFAFVDDYLGFDADFNLDGVTDSDDFFSFVQEFFAGC